MDNFDLRKYLAEGRLLKEEQQFDDQTSFPKDASTAKAVVTQLQSGNPDAPIIKAMKERGDAKKAKAWVEKIGPNTVLKRILTIANKIPTQGLAKADMPFLPGPPDAKGTPSDVEDALTPGGKYNVDFKEAIKPPAKNTLEPGSKEADDYLTSGEDDGKPNDDNVTVKAPSSVAASDAKPTQTNILLAKSLSMAIGGVEGGDIGAWIGTDGSILDGHHRWAATMLNNPNAKLGAAGAIDLGAMGDQTTALKHLTAIGNALGNKTKVKEALKMKELNKFRQFINEDKEKVDELFGLRGKPGEAKKAAKALDALEKALFELNFLDILGQEDYEDWLIKYEKLRGRVMAGLEDSDRKKYDVAYGSAEGDLDENDATLDEVINEYDDEEEYKKELERDILGITKLEVDLENLIRDLKRWNNDGKTKNGKYGEYIDKEFNGSMNKNPNSIYTRLLTYNIGGNAHKILSKVATEWKRGENDFMKFGNMMPELSEVLKAVQKTLKFRQDNLFKLKNKPKGELTIYDTWKEQNDAALDEIINEAKPNLKKALPTIAARNVERNNLINADIEDMMDMVGGAGKGEGSEEAEILFKASNASSDLEQALTDLQMYFEDDLGEGKEEE